MTLTKHTDVLRALWLGLTPMERWLLIAEGKRATTTTLGDVARVRSALRECIEAERPS